MKLKEQLKLRLPTESGPISSFANAIRPLGIDLDVVDYKEHGIGKGRDVKAATFIQCTAAGVKNKQWYVLK